MTPSPPIPHHPVAGVDVDGGAFWCVVLDAGSAVVAATRVAAAEEAAAVVKDHHVTVVAVDSPGALSTAPYAGDETVGRKFRSGRGCEVTLGREHGIWVPWSTPTDAAALPPWMARGIALHEALRNDGHETLEVYPYAVFRLLAAGRLPRKTTPEGRAARLRLLGEAGVTGLGPASGHDVVDAATAALVALHRAQGRARAARCPLDRTAIWLPAAVPEPASAPLRRR
jgi:predicted nuclease with RNAse H fold